MTKRKHKRKVLRAICSPADRPDRVGTSTRGTCSECGCDVWVAPATASVGARGRRLVLMCVECVPMRWVTEIITTDEQRAEIDAVMPGVDVVDEVADMFDADVTNLDDEDN